MAKVTFTNNVDHYVRGDTHDLSSDELKRVDAYAKKWKIEKPYVKGEATAEQLAVELPNPRKRRNAKRTQPAPKAEKAAKPAKVEDEPKEPVTPPADETDPATELPEDKGNPAAPGEGENPEGDDPGSES